VKGKTKKNISLPKYKRFILVIFVCLFVFSSPLTTPKAQALWPDIPGFTYKQMLEDIRDRIKGIVMGMLKQKAVETISKQVDSMIAGKGKGGAKIITDWEEYLYKTPDKNTKLYMNDYLSKITSGRGSKSGYKSASEGFSLGSVLGSSSSSGGGGGYASQLVAMAKRNTTERKDPKLTYEGDPSKMFAGKTFKDFSTYTTGINPSWSFEATAQAEFVKKTEQERKLADTKSKAYLGGIGVGEGANGKGKISLPGSVVVQTKSNTMDLGNKVIASANHPEEVISALVSKILSEAMKQGVGMLQSKLGKLPFGSNLSSVTKGLNPSSVFKSTTTTTTTTTRASSVPPPARNF